MLSIQCDAYTLGVVLGQGARFMGRGRISLEPAILVVPEGWGTALRSDHVGESPALAVDILDPATDASAARVLRERYAAAGAQEYWQLRVEAPSRPAFFQLGQSGAYDLVSPDRNGDYFSSLGESLVIPARWFEDQPDIWTMMREWSIIDD